MLCSSLFYGVCVCFSQETPLFFFFFFSHFLFFQVSVEVVDFVLEIDFDNSWQIEAETPARFIRAVSAGEDVERQINMEADAEWSTVGAIFSKMAADKIGFVELVLAFLEVLSLKDCCFSLLLSYLESSPFLRQVVGISLSDAWRSRRGRTIDRSALDVVNSILVKRGCILAEGKRRLDSVLSRLQAKTSFPTDALFLRKAASSTSLRSLMCTWDEDMFEKIARLFGEQSLLSFYERLMANFKTAVGAKGRSIQAVQKRLQEMSKQEERGFTPFLLALCTRTAQPSLLLEAQLSEKELALLEASPWLLQVLGGMMPCSKKPFATNTQNVNMNANKSMARVWDCTGMVPGFSNFVPLVPADGDTNSDVLLLVGVPRCCLCICCIFLFGKSNLLFSVAFGDAPEVFAPLLGLGLGSHFAKLMQKYGVASAGGDGKSFALAVCPDLEVVIAPSIRKDEWLFCGRLFKGVRLSCFSPTVHAGAVMDDATWSLGFQEICLACDVALQATFSAGRGNADPASTSHQFMFSCFSTGLVAAAHSRPLPRPRALYFPDPNIVSVYMELLSIVEEAVCMFPFAFPQEFFEGFGTCLRTCRLCLHSGLLLSCRFVTDILNLSLQQLYAHLSQHDVVVSERTLVDGAVVSVMTAIAERRSLRKLLPSHDSGIVVKEEPLALVPSTPGAAYVVDLEAPVLDRSPASPSPVKKERGSAWCLACELEMQALSGAEKTTLYTTTQYVFVMEDDSNTLHLFWSAPPEGVNCKGTKLSDVRKFAHLPLAYTDNLRRGFGKKTGRVYYPSDCTFVAKKIKIEKNE